MKKVLSKSKVILRADVDNLGRVGDIVEVKPGYARNYLIPQGYASMATEGNIKVFEQERKKLEAAMNALRSEAQTLAQKLETAEVVINVRVGESDKLYGSVTNANLGDSLAAQGLEVDRRKILLEEPIRALGLYSVPVKLHPDVTVDLTVKVMRHGVSQEEAEAEIAPAPVEEATATEAPEAFAEAGAADVPVEEAAATEKAPVPAEEEVES